MHFRGADPYDGPAETPNIPSHNHSPQKLDGIENLMTLKQAYSSEYQGVQGAFKDSMIH